MTNKASTGPYIPTGYEGVQRGIASKRKIADAMLEAGLAGPGVHARSPFQLLGTLAQAWAGKSMNREADQEETDINNERLEKYRTSQKAIQDALLAPDADIAKIAGQFGGDPNLQDSPVMKAITDALATRLSNKETARGDPSRFRDANGNIVSVQGNAAGGFTPLSNGLQVLPKMTEIGQVAVDLDAQPSGAVLPANPNELGIRGPAGELTTNEPLRAAKEAVARAGATTVSSTFQEAEDKSLGRILPIAVMEGITKTRSNAEVALQALPAIAQAKIAAKNLYSGSFANARLQIMKGFDLFGVGGADTQAKIRNSEVYVQSIGQQLFPILQALRPASDTDLKVAKQMAGGDLTLSSAAMRHAVEAAEQAAHRTIKGHNIQVDKIAEEFNVDQNAGPQIRSFKVIDPTVPAKTPGVKINSKEINDLIDQYTGGN